MTERSALRQGRSLLNRQSGIQSPPAVPGPLRVALIQQYDARDIRNWSGILHFARAAVERHLGPVVDLSPAPLPLLPLQGARGLLRVATGRRWSFDHDPLLARFYGRYFGRRIAEVEPDLIFAPAGSACVAFLETQVPILYYSDATWRRMQGYYPSYSNLVRRTARGGDLLERRTLERAAVALFSSEWAASSAVQDYGTDASKVHVVYIGANLTRVPTREEVLPRKLGRRLRLLFVGVRWDYKGGQLAFETLLRLLDRGCDAELTVVGCSVPRGIAHPRLRVIPFLDKRIAQQRERFERLWREADFFLLPTRFEAAGLVFCEAAAHALPVITTRTGGVSSLVVDGRNGYALAPEAGAEAYARRIAELAEDAEAYDKLAVSSREEFEQRLNWDAWGVRVARILEERLPQVRGRLAGSSPAGEPHLR